MGPSEDTAAVDNQLSEKEKATLQVKLTIITYTFSTKTSSYRIYCRFSTWMPNPLYCLTVQCLGENIEVGFVWISLYFYGTQNLNIMPA